MLSQKPWRSEAVILLIGGVLSCLFLGIVAVGLLRLAGMDGFRSPDGFGSVLVATLSFQGAAWFLIYFFLKMHGLDWRDAFGLRNANLIIALSLAFVFLIVALLPVLYLQRLSALVLDHLGWLPQDQRAVDLLVGAQSPWMRGYLAFFAVVLAPVAEEFIFRGVLFPFIKQRGWPKLAWLGVSLLFAAIHINAPTFLSLFALALVFTWLYEVTDCLLAPILAHSLFNGINLVVLFLQTR